MTTISVIIPTYNDSQHLSRAIDSALQQTIEVHEIIVVDDASTEDISPVLAQYDDDRIIVERHQTNRGGSAARNTGIKLATGDYLAFLDADDEWLESKLERQLEVLEALSAEWVAVHCAREYEFDPVQKIGLIISEIIDQSDKATPKEGGEELIKEILLINLSTGASTLMVTQDVAEAIGGFDPAFPRHQDWEFLIRVLQHGKLAYVDRPLVVKHGTGRPDASVHEEAKQLLLTNFNNEISALEADGYPVRRVQQLHLAKLYFEDGEFIAGIRRIPRWRLRIPEYLSLVWSFALGIGTKIRRFR